MPKLKDRELTGAEFHWAAHTLEGRLQVCFSDETGRTHLLTLTVNQDALDRIATAAEQTASQLARNAKRAIAKAKEATAPPIAK